MIGFVHAWLCSCGKQAPAPRANSLDLAQMSIAKTGQDPAKPFKYVDPTPNTIPHVNLQDSTTNLRRLGPFGESGGINSLYVLTYLWGALTRRWSAAEI